MRHLIACAGCRRQYDVSGLAVGSTLPCACGEQVRVAEARPHDASVVRCSSCGATRAEGQPACGYCGSDFTLHEQDLHTICPGCLARISDRARFCHHCAVAVAPQPAATAGKPRPCPSCPRVTLAHRALPRGPALLECTTCLGLWIEPQALRDVLRSAAAGGRAVGAAFVTWMARPTSKPPPLPARQVVYLACPECNARMNRRRFPGAAGVVVDFCRDHGLWFEVQELERVVQAAADGLGGAQEPGRLPGDEALEARQKIRERNEAWRAQGPLPPDVGLGLFRPSSVLDEVLAFVGRLFGDH